jgi:hypothetical protein
MIQVRGYTICCRAILTSPHRPVGSRRLPPAKRCWGPVPTASFLGESLRRRLEQTTAPQSTYTVTRCATLLPIPCTFQRCSSGWVSPAASVARQRSS